MFANTATSWEWGWRVEIKHVCKGLHKMSRSLQISHLCQPWLPWTGGGGGVKFHKNFFAMKFLNNFLWYFTSHPCGMGGWQTWHFCANLAILYNSSKETHLGSGATPIPLSWDWGLAHMTVLCRCGYTMQFLIKTNINWSPLPHLTFLYWSGHFIPFLAKIILLPHWPLHPTPIMIELHGASI